MEQHNKLKARTSPIVEGVNWSSIFKEDKIITGWHYNGAIDKYRVHFTKGKDVEMSQDELTLACQKYNSYTPVWVPENTEMYGDNKMSEKRRFCVGEQFMTQSHEAACESIENKYPGLGLKPDGAFMDVANFSAYITEGQAHEHGIDWDALGD